MSGTGPGPVLVVASTDAGLRDAAAAASGGRAVHAADDAKSAARLLAAHPSAILVLDVELTGDPLLMLRSMADAAQKKRVAVVLACPATTARETLQAFIAAGARQAVVKPTTAEPLAEKIAAAAGQLASGGQDSAKPQALARAKGGGAAAAEPKGKPQAAVAVEGNNSILARAVACPFHEEAVTFTQYTLRSGRIRTETDILDITQYVEPLRGADFCDFNLLAVSVCPKCLFATNNPDYFRRPNEPKHKPHEFDEATWAAVVGGAEQRRASVGAALDEAFFTHTRSKDGAVLSYRLAMQCSELLYKANKLQFPIELVRAANHHLRLGQFIKQGGGGDAKVRGEFAVAFKQLQEAFAIVQGPPFFKAAYQLAVLAIYLHEDKQAMQYINRLQLIDREGKVSPEHKTALQSYLGRAQTAWQDRDMHRGPEPESTEAAKAA